jgi:NitT/TauT family transport system substrate-binding protein
MTGAIGSRRFEFRCFDQELATMSFARNRRVSSGVAALLIAVGTLGLSMTGAAADLPAVAIGLAHSAASASLYIGVANRYFADEGLDAQLKFFNSDLLVQRAVAEGKLDFGVASLTASFFDYAAKHRLKIIASQVSDQAGYPATALLINKKAYEAGFRSVKDFPNRRIGMTTPGSGERYALVRIAAKYRLGPDAIKFVWLKTLEKEMATFSRGEVDAVVLPFATALKFYSSGKGALLIRLSDFTEWQQGVVFTRAQTIEANRSNVEKFMRAYQRSVAEYDLTFQQRDDEATALPGPRFREYLMLIANQAKLPPELLQYALPYCDHLARLDVTDIENQLKFWQGQGMADKAITAADLLDLSFIGSHIGR